MDRLLMFIATGGGSGYLPKAPGTWGTLVGLVLWWPLAGLSLAAYLAAVGLLFAVGVASAGAAEKILDRGDPGVVVIDEIVGVLIALTAAPLHPAAALVGFALFRVFDILKPWPICWFDRHVEGGLGIMLDDIVAGIFACLTLQLLAHFVLPL